MDFGSRRHNFSNNFSFNPNLEPRHHNHYNNEPEAKEIDIQNECQDINEIENNGKGPCSWLDDDIDNESKRKKEEKLNNFRVTYSGTRSFFDGGTKSLESKLDEERIKVTRLQNEIEKLNSQIKFLQKNSGPNSSNSILKYLPEISYGSLGIGKKIGAGGFSEIFEAQWLGYPVAVKVMSDPKITNELMDEFNNEVEKLFMLRHPNIIQIFGLCPTTPKLAVVTELAPNGSLFDYLHREKNNLSLEIKYKFTRQLINVMFYIHSRGYVHRDLKTQNLLLDSNNDIKLCDFGLTKLKEELNLGSGQFAGTPCYMAPELFDKKYYDEKVDIFAFGTILWEIFNQKVPYCNCNASEIKQKVCRGDKLESSESVPKKIAELIDACRSLKAHDRPSFEYIFGMDLF